MGEKSRYLTSGVLLCFLTQFPLQPVLSLLLLVFSWAVFLTFVPLSSTPIKRNVPLGFFCQDHSVAGPLQPPDAV